MVCKYDHPLPSFSPLTWKEKKRTFWKMTFADSIGRRRCWISIFVGQLERTALYLIRVQTGKTYSQKSQNKSRSCLKVTWQRWQRKRTRFEFLKLGNAAATSFAAIKAIKRRENGGWYKIRRRSGHWSSSCLPDIYYMATMLSSHWLLLLQHQGYQIKKTNMNFMKIFICILI